MRTAWFIIRSIFYVACIFCAVALSFALLCLLVSTPEGCVGLGILIAVTPAGVALADQLFFGDE